LVSLLILFAWQYNFISIETQGIIRFFIIEEFPDYLNLNYKKV